MNPLRCPHCDKKLGDHMEEGLYINTCPRCHRLIIIDRRIPSRVK